MSLKLKDGSRTYGIVHVPTGRFVEAFTSVTEPNWRLCERLLHELIQSTLPDESRQRVAIMTDGRNEPGCVIMQAVVGQTFAVGKLTAIVEAVSESGISITLARVSTSGFTRTGVGVLTVLYPCTGVRRVRMLLAFPVEYQGPEFWESLRRAVFEAVGIPLGETWMMEIAPPCVGEFRSDAPEGVIEIYSW